jgi:hypothetical protein
MSSINNKSIRFPSVTNDKLEKTALKLGRSKVTVFMQMVDYFLRTGKDPLDIGDELLKKALSKSHDSLTSFIKVQERDLLIPMHTQVKRMIANQEKINVLLTRVDNGNLEIKSGQESAEKQSMDNSKILRVLYSHLEEKVRLKDKFIVVLRSYVKERESLSSFSMNDVKKTQLIDKAIDKVKQL